MGVVNIQHDTQIETHMSITDFAKGIHQLDLSEIPEEKRGIAVLRHMARIAASEAASPVDQRRLLGQYIEAVKNDPDA